MTIQSLRLLGDVTATLTDAQNYQLPTDAFTLGVAEPRPGEIGGVGPINEVDGEIGVNVFSTPRSLTTTLSNLAALGRIKHQVKRSQKSAAASPVPRPAGSKASSSLITRSAWRRPCRGSITRSTRSLKKSAPTRSLLRAAASASTAHSSAASSPLVRRRLPNCAEARA